MNVMTSIYRYALALCMVAAAGALSAQNASTSSGVRRVGDDDKRPAAQAQVSDRMQMRQAADSRVPDDDAQWMKVVYRSLDLAKVPNASLYYPQEVVDGQENLFRIIMNRFASGELTAYEYLDGREMFTEQYRVNPVDVLERFHVPYTEAGSGARRRYAVEESDVPCNEVLSYYIIERWELDRSTTRMTTTVQALCPVLHRAGDFGGEDVRYPMFWVKMDDLRPYLLSTTTFVDDDNNASRYTYDDFFALSLYDGEIYKTRNLRNLSMMQMYPDPDDRRRAQDSIQHRLETFDDMMWVPTREEVQARGGAESADSVAVGEYRKEAKPASHSRKPAKVKAPKKPKSSADSGAKRSVRRRR